MTEQAMNLPDPVPPEVGSPPEFVTVDRNNPVSIMEALGFPPDKVQSLVLTPRGILGISSDYPPTPFDPDAPEPAPEPPVDPDLEV